MLKHLGNNCLEQKSSIQQEVILLPDFISYLTDLRSEHNTVNTQTPSNTIQLPDCVYQKQDMTIDCWLLIIDQTVC